MTTTPINVDAIATLLAQRALDVDAIDARWQACLAAHLDESLAIVGDAETPLDRQDFVARCALATDYAHADEFAAISHVLLQLIVQDARFYRALIEARARFVLWRAAKCPNEWCVEYGACGHHGPDGSCLARRPRR